MAITTTTSLGTIIIPDGVRLFGTVLEADAQPAVQCDVDVLNATTGVELALCNDNTNAAGAYSVYVPTGTYDVVFTPFGSKAPIDADVHQNVVVSGATQLDGQLPVPVPGHPTRGPTGGAPIGLDAGAAHGPHSGRAPAPVLVADEAGSLGLAPRAPGRQLYLLLGESPAALRSGIPCVAPLRLGAGGSLRVPPGVRGRFFVRSLELDARGHAVAGPIQMLRF